MSVNRVPGFLPSTSGLHFSNSYPDNTDYPFVELPVVKRIISADAGNGICGGFVYTVLDLFLAKPRLQPPPNATRPDPGTPRFTYLVERLLDSLGKHRGWDNAIKAIEWTQISGHDVELPLSPHGLAHRMVYDEWPKIKSDIDSGTPSPLMLVMAPQCGPADIVGIKVALGRSHQVLAYAYRLDGDNLELSIYDCNDPDNDSSTLELNISQPEHTIEITASAMRAKSPIRGLFRSEYSFNYPTPFKYADQSYLPPLLLFSYSMVSLDLSYLVPLLL